MMSAIKKVHTLIGRLSILAFLFLLLVAIISGQANEKDTPWSRSAEERDSRMEKAEREKYYVRWIYIGGNTYTRHRDFRKRMSPDFNGGFLFTRKELEKSIKRIARMRSIFPISINDVDVMLDGETKSIDFTINVRQRSRD